jgi:hypothetical protein
MMDALAPYRRLITLVLALLALAGAAYGAYALRQSGIKQGELQCAARQLKAVVAAEDKGKKETTKDIARSQSTGAARESGRRALDALFDQLAKEAHDAPTDPIDTAVLPADRLRLWNAANDGGTGASAPTAEPDSAAPATAPSPFWAGARLGGQPPPSGPAIPPASPAAVPATGLPATDAP